MSLSLREENAPLRKEIDALWEELKLLNEMNDQLHGRVAELKAESLLLGQAQQLIGALISHGLIAKSLPEADYLNLWDVVKRQLRCVNLEGARNATTPQPEQRQPMTDEQFAKIKTRLSRQHGWEGMGWDQALKEEIERFHGITKGD